MSDSAARNVQSIPVGFYDEVARDGHPVRQAWHLLKFTRVLEALPAGSNQSLLDVGCFAGTFLSLCPEDRFSRQLGVDILPEQIAYASARFGSSFRKFRALESVDDLSAMDEPFDAVTAIELIEHLREDEIASLTEGISKRVRAGGYFVLSTPNYTSSWPLLEWYLNRISDVNYEEQHITRFNHFNAPTKLRRISRALREDFELDFATTTHFVSPFLGGVGVRFARGMSKVVSHRYWRNPFGNLLLMRWRKK
jgi:2-polyprenyl-3-methyl-5-hydroxy-6-metoxy-1,4-benzoquinol methylase